jgi:hypothetical protein
MVDAKQLMTRGLSWFRPGAVRPAVVCFGHYIAQHRGACSGAATSKAGEEEWPPSPCEVAEDVVVELRNACVVRSLVSVVLCPVPCGGGVHLPFIGQGEGELHVCRTIQLHGEARCAAP